MRGGGARGRRGGGRAQGRASARPGERKAGRAQGRESARQGERQAGRARGGASGREGGEGRWRLPDHWARAGDPSAGPASAGALPDLCLGTLDWCGPLPRGACRGLLPLTADGWGRAAGAPDDAMMGRVGWLTVGSGCIPTRPRGLGWIIRPSAETAVPAVGVRALLAARRPLPVVLSAARAGCGGVNPGERYGGGHPGARKSAVGV